jgi:SAM-dependent methyltransferase
MNERYPMSWEEAVTWFCAQPQHRDVARAAYLDEPLGAAAERYAASAEFAEVLKIIGPKPGRALDLGAGGGILSFALAKAGWAVTAVEPDPSERIGAGSIRRIARETGVAITVIEAFGEAIPLDQAGFDLVMARQVLHHARDLGAFCSEMARLVRPGGLVMTLRDHVITDASQMQPFLDRHPLHNLYGGENAFTLNEYRDALRNAGLVIAREIGSFDSPINSEPITLDMLRDHLASAIRSRLRIGPPSALIGLVPERAIRTLATMIDRRPGRLVSFVAQRPASGSNGPA